MPHCFNLKHERKRGGFFSDFVPGIVAREALYRRISVRRSIPGSEEMQDIMVDDTRDPHHRFHGDIDFSKLNLSDPRLRYPGRRGHFLLRKALLYPGVPAIPSKDRT